MIYLDTSVALAQLLAEDRVPPPALWSETLVASRLTEYEIWTRIRARGLGGSHGDAVRELLGRLAFVELIAPVLEDAVSGFADGVERPSVQLRTLDALHLASASFLRRQGVPLTIASYDDRLRLAATRLGFGLYPLD